MAPQNITKCFISIRIGRHARQGGGGEEERWKGGLRIAIRLVISTQHRAAIWSGKIRYDYRVRAERLWQPKQSATVRSHFKVNQHGEVLDFGERWAVCFHTKRQKGWNKLRARNMFETQEPCRDIHSSLPKDSSLKVLECLKLLRCAEVFKRLHREALNGRFSLCIFSKTSPTLSLLGWEKGVWPLCLESFVI